MGILDAPAFSPKKARLSSLLTRLAGPNTLPVPAVAPAADTPTITAGTTATVTGTHTQFGAHNTSMVTEVGSRGSYSSSLNRLVVSGKGTPSGLDFYLTGDTIEFELLSTGSGNLPLWIWVNGAPLTSTPDVTTLNAPASNSIMFLKLVFPSSARRRIEIFTTGSGAALNAWRPIRTGITNLVTPAPRRPVVAFISDSFFAGSAATTELLSSAFLASRMLGVECVNISMGGTGYVAAGSFTVFGSSTRTAIAAAANPELLVFAGSVNDDGNSATVGAAAAAAYAAFAAACPNARAIVFGPQPSSATATISANRAAVNDAVRDAAVAAPNVIGYHDMVGTVEGLPAAWSSGTTYSDGALVTHKGSVWKAMSNGATFSGDIPGSSARWNLQTFVFTGTGNSGGVVGDGTRDVYLYSDSVHPTVEGSAALAIRQANLIRTSLAAAAA